MADWTYGDEGKKYPVRRGEVWKVGNHTFVCSDLMNDSVFHDVLATHSPKPTLLYSDPPWSQGNLNAFQTKAGLPAATYRWEALYQRIAAIAAKFGVPLYIEASHKDSRDGAKVPETIKAAGKATSYWPIFYYRDKPCGLFYAGPTPPPPGLNRILPNLDDEYTPLEVMKAYGPNGVVIDPCDGIGTTPLRAQQAGWGSVTNELHPNRMSVALVTLAKETKTEPVRVR